jgi:pyruvate dehydrogenase E2 component (dihydrolipoamide acetyltransferase)
VSGVPEFVMPSLGADMSAGTLTAWLKHPGDAVRRGDIVAVVETDKADVEVEVFADGVIEQLLVGEGTKVPVGTPLALISGHGEPAAPAAGPPGPPPAPTAAAPAPAGPSRALVRAPGERLLISPAARRLAEALGVDPAAIAGSGPGGRIVERDVQRAAEAAAPAPVPGAPAAESRSARMRRVIAAAMSRSNREIPHYYLDTTIDLGPALDWLREQNLARPLEQRLLPGVLMLRATALALREVPQLNGHWVGDAAVTSEAVHLGVAISLRGGGLVAPALHDADRLALDELMAAFRDLVTRARALSLRSSELADPTCTVTSLGEQGVEGVHGVIFPPQLAIVGFGTVVERPWARHGGLLVAPVVRATLSGDHRASDGHEGARLLAAIDRLLQEPGRL